MNIKFSFCSKIIFMKNISSLNPNTKLKESRATTDAEQDWVGWRHTNGFTNIFLNIVRLFGS